MSEPFVWPVRVYWEDTDAGGVVYHANYLNFMERARTEWLRALGYEQDRLREEEGLIFAVRAMQLDFLKPARFNDALEVVVGVERKRRASLELMQTIRPQGDPARVLCSAAVKVACLDAASFRPTAIPSRMLGEITVE